MDQLKITALATVVTWVAMLGVSQLAVASETLTAHLDASKEIPVCSSTGSGTFQAKVSDDETSIDYELTYDLDGTVRQAHIHFGPFTDRGGIIVWLCQTLTNPGPAGTPTCPDTPDTATVTGTLAADDVLTVDGQGINAGEFAELLGALRSGLTYANVHSSICGGGEIRGQIRRGQ